MAMSVLSTWAANDDDDDEEKEEFFLQLNWIVFSHYQVIYGVFPEF